MSSVGALRPPPPPHLPPPEWYNQQHVATTINEQYLLCKYDRVCVCVLVRNVLEPLYLFLNFTPAALSPENSIGYTAAGAFS